LPTRVESDQWVIEQARDEGYGVKVGDAYSFADTCCAHMIEGKGPRFAPETSAVASYAAAGERAPWTLASSTGAVTARAKAHRGEEESLPRLQRLG
jgi:hypothetical protein